MSQGFRFAGCWTPTSCDVTNRVCRPYLLKIGFVLRSEESDTSSNQCKNNFWCQTLDIIVQHSNKKEKKYWHGRPTTRITGLHGLSERERERRKAYLKSNIVADLADFDLVLIHGADVWLHLYNTPGRQSVFTLFLNQWRHKVGARGGYTQIHHMHTDNVQTDLWMWFTSFSHLSCTSRVKRCSVALFFSFFVASMSALFRMSVEEAFPFSEATIRSIWIRTVPDSCETFSLWHSWLLPTHDGLPWLRVSEFFFFFLNCLQNITVQDFHLWK